MTLQTRFAKPPLMKDGLQTCISISNKIAGLPEPQSVQQNDQISFFLPIGKDRNTKITGIYNQTMCVTGFV